jgi:hypothetical protein
VFTPRQYADKFRKWKALGLSTQSQVGRNRPIPWTVCHEAVKLDVSCQNSESSWLKSEKGHKEEAAEVTKERNIWRRGALITRIRWQSRTMLAHLTQQAMKRRSTALNVQTSDEAVIP